MIQELQLQIFCVPSIIVSCISYRFCIDYFTSIISQHSQQYINYCCNHTVILCTYMLALYLSCMHKAIVHGSVLFNFQTKDSDTHVYADSWSSQDGDRNHRYNFFVLASFFFRWVKEINETTKLETRFFYNLFSYTYLSL